MLAGVRVSTDELIAPIFVREGRNISQKIPSMPGQYQYSVDQAMETIRRWSGKGLRAVLLFGIPESKDPTGSYKRFPRNLKSRRVKLPQMDCLVLRSLAVLAAVV